MKKAFRSTFAAGLLTLLGLGAMSSVHAAPLLLSSDGSGAAFASAQDALGLMGVGFVQFAGYDANGVPLFQENGAFEVVSPVGTNDLTMVYSLQGYFDPFSGQLFIASGIIDLYSDANFDFGSSSGILGADNGVRVATFDVTGGGSDLNTGLVDMEASLESGTLLSGYLFDASGRDMSGLASVTLSASLLDGPIAGDSTIIQALVCSQAGRSDLGCDSSTYANQSDYFLVGDIGAVSINAVPEPASMSLALAGLLGIGFSARRRSAGQPGC